MKASNASTAAALVSAIQISCNARLAFGCWLFGNLAITFAVLCTQQRCSRVFGQTSPAAFQNPIAPLPRGMFVKPTILQTADGGCRQPGSILAEQRRQSLGEVSGGDTLQIEDRQQRLDRFRAAHVGGQDRRREADAVGIGSVRLTIAYTRLADGDRTDTGHHLAFR